MQFLSVRNLCQILGLLPDIYGFRPEISRISRSNLVSFSNPFIFSRQGRRVRYKKNAAELTSAAHPYIPKHIPEKRSIRPTSPCIGLQIIRPEPFRIVQNWVHSSVTLTLQLSHISEKRWGKTMALTESQTMEFRHPSGNLCRELYCALHRKSRRLTDGRSRQGRTVPFRRTHEEHQGTPRMDPSHGSRITPRFGPLSSSTWGAKLCEAALFAEECESILQEPINNVCSSFLLTRGPIAAGSPNALWIAISLIAETERI